MKYHHDPSNQYLHGTGTISIIYSLHTWYTYYLYHVPTTSKVQSLHGLWDTLIMLTTAWCNHNLHGNGLSLPALAVWYTLWGTPIPPPHDTTNHHMYGTTWYSHYSTHTIIIMYLPTRPPFHFAWFCNGIKHWCWFWNGMVLNTEKGKQNEKIIKR